MIHRDGGQKSPKVWPEETHSGCGGGEYLVGVYAQLTYGQEYAVECWRISQ